MEETRFNAGYEIIMSRKVGDSEIVIGENKKIGEFACWFCRGDNDYNIGYYSNDYDSVKEKFDERIATQSELSAPPIKPKRHEAVR